jgi:ketosteroid isomerase-like protein
MAATSAGEVHRALIALHQNGRFDEALQLIDPDAIDHRGGAEGDVVGRSAWREKWIRAAGTDFGRASLVIDENIEASDTSVNRYTVRGRDSSSGKPFAVTAIDMVKVRDGRVTEHWALFDVSGLQHQLRA